WLEDLEVSIVISVRTSEPGEDPGLLDQILADPVTTIVRPAPLSATAVAQLVRERLSPDADAEFCRSCHEATGGNPLLVHELLTACAGEGIEPPAAHVPDLRGLAARAGWRAVSVRLLRLPAASNRLAEAVAILGDDADPHQAAALAGLDEEAASEASADLVRVDILRPSTPLGFVHPLVRTAVYEGLTALERERGHAEAARLLSTAGA